MGCQGGHALEGVLCAHGHQAPSAHGQRAQRSITPARTYHHAGIEQHGIVEVEGERIYAYEVDGLGNHLADFDDANGALH